MNFSLGAWVWTLQRDVNVTDFGVSGQGKLVYIMDYAWISCRTVLLPRVIVEVGTVIAAGGVQATST